MPTVFKQALGPHIPLYFTTGRGVVPDKNSLDKTGAAPDRLLPPILSVDAFPAERAERPPMAAESPSAEKMGNQAGKRHNHTDN